MSGILRDKIKVHLWGAEEALKILKGRLTREGFTVTQEYVGRLYRDENPQVLYGGADESELDVIANEILAKVFPKVDFSRERTWHTQDADVYIQIPLDLIPSNPAVVIFYDPQRGCHLHLPTEEWKVHATATISAGGYLIKGIFSPHTPHKIVTKEEDI